jgi:6-pyruvoyl-tetrahydropterin synthase
MKFSCAHFIAYDGFRERLHGHNYNLTLRLIGKVRSSRGTTNVLIEHATGDYLRRLSIRFRSR